MAKFLGKAFLVIAIIVAVIYFGAIYLIKKDFVGIQTQLTKPYILI